MHAILTLSLIWLNLSDICESTLICRTTPITYHLPRNVQTLAFCFSCNVHLIRQDAKAFVQYGVSFFKLLHDAWTQGIEKIIAENPYLEKLRFQ